MIQSHCDWITATPRLEPIEYVKKPLVITRFLCLLFAIIVFGVVHNDCYVYEYCVFNNDIGTCRFASFLGIATMLLCIPFLLLDACVDNISNCRTRIAVITADLFLTCAFGVLWFICFCLMCNRWQNTDAKFFDKLDTSAAGPRAAIAFTFFTFAALGMLGYLCSLTYRTVRLFVNAFTDMAATETNAQTGPFNPRSDFIQPPYHGFVPDQDLLDASSRPAKLQSDSPNFPRPGGEYFSNTIEAYQL